MTKIIAELGINHNGSLSVLRQMVEAANAAGADYVKLQKRDIDTCYTREELDRPCKSPWGKMTEDKVRGRELSWDDISAFSDLCEERNIGWGCSCFDMKSLTELYNRFGDQLAFNKIPSAMSIHDRFVWKVADQNLLTLISCGLAKSREEVTRICDHFETARTLYVLNITTALYPCPPNRCNLKRIQSFMPWKTAILNHPHCKGIGYSGHEVGVLPSVIAAWSGATWIERHFTLDRSMYGADQAASLEPEGLRRLVRDIRELDEIGGSSEIKLYGDEKNPVPHLRGE